MMKTEFVVHENETRWGRVWHILGEGGKGYLKVSYENDDPGTLTLHSLSVYKDSRGQGLGKLLLQEAEKIGRSMEDVDTLELAVEKPNDRLVEYYKEEGYQVVCEDSEYFYLLKSL